MNLLTFLKKSISGHLSAEKQIEFLNSKMDITPKELSGVVLFLQKQIAYKPHLKNAIDICGTGGSGLDRINTSTIAAFILAKLGVSVAKHGNKAASGRFGSFDLLEALGAAFNADVATIERQYEKEKLAFLFAPFFHPVMKNFAEMRKNIGKATFFNLLGPLLNPAFPKRQIIGTAFRDKMRLIAETCKLLGKEKVYIVCGEDGLDEVTLTGRTFVTELSEGKIKSYTISPADFGIEKAAFSESAGGNGKFNTKIALEILEGRCKTRHKDLVLVNCGLALKLAGKVKTLKEGYEMAKMAIDAPNILLQIVEHKKIEVAKRRKKHPVDEFLNNLSPSNRYFAAAIAGKGLSLIAEIKKASPSAGKVHIKNFDPVAIARKYERAGASAISVLCDEKFFQGNLNYMKKVAENTFKTPILCKDFIIDEYQIYEARKYGADAILLIAAILTSEQISKYIKIAKSLNMAAICEIHTLEELEKVLKTPAKIIGINNRDLNTFKIDVATTSKIAGRIPAGKIVVSESGFSTKADLQKLPKNVDAILVGTALMKGGNVNEFAARKIKICGIRQVKDAVFCEKIGVDFIGLNFVPTSKRCINLKTAQMIVRSVKTIAKVGVFQNQTIQEVNNIAQKLGLDYVQLSGDESVEFVKKCDIPVIKTIALRQKNDLIKAEKYLPYVTYILFDGAAPGSGKSINVSLKNVKYPFMVAGGINIFNVEKIVKVTNPLAIDIASGIETNGKIDTKKINLIFNKLKTC